MSPEEAEKHIKEVKGRGVGKSVILKNWKLIVDAWEERGIDATVKIAEIDRFCGAKTSISRSGRGFRRASGGVTKEGRPKPHYGQWIKRPVEMTFAPKPKRDGTNPDGTLKLRKFPQDLKSVPYERAMKFRNAEALEMIAAQQEILEQPDCDLAEYDLNYDATG